MDFKCRLILFTNIILITVLVAYIYWDETTNWHKAECHAAEEQSANESEIYEEPECGYIILEEERVIVEKVVAGEARGESIPGMVAVAQTIKDRGDLWGMSYKAVCLQEGQYYTGYEGEISEDVEYAVSLVFDYGARAFEEPTTHFYSTSLMPEAPYWAESKICRGQIGDHCFYY